MIAFIAIFTALGLFFSALLLCLAFVRVVTRLGTWLGTWPARPMDNQERKAAWALKYHQATPITPNTHPWAWLTKNTGRVWVEIKSRHWAWAPGTLVQPCAGHVKPITVKIEKGNDHE